MPDAIAVNPETHMVYIADRMNGFVYVINSKCIIEHKKCNDKAVKVRGEVNISQPIGIAVNQNTNMVYVTNQASNTVSVINGKTSNISVSVNFSINPKGSGTIVCDDNQRAAPYMFYDVNSTHKCSAIPGNNFVFGSWSDESSHSNLTDPVNFKPSDFGGSWTANFNQKPPIPTEFLYGVVLGPTVGAVLGGFLGWWIPYYMNKRATKK